MKNKIKNISIINIIYLIFLTIFIILSVILVKEIININILPNKYLIILIILFLLLIMPSILIIRKNGKVKNIFSVLFITLFIILSVLELFVLPKINKVNEFISNNTKNSYTTNVYKVIVNKDSSYKNLSDISGKEIVYYNDLKDKNKLKEKIKNNIENPKLKETENVNDSLNEVKSNKDLILIVNSGYYDSVSAIDLTFNKKTRVIASINVKEKNTLVKETSDVVTDKPFLLFVNGIDTRSGKLPARSLSDVNILMAVNPNTHKILLVHIPRDSYVQLHGTTGLKDKLTHSGTTGGGITSTIATIEDLMGLKINYYTRSNFNSVKTLVDQIGGIDIYNDQTFNITAWTDRACSYTPGWNRNVDGRCSLAFSRERKSYEDGDRHRGRNQEQVIERVIEKFQKNPSLLNKYEEILNSMNGTFETNLSSKDITTLVKNQLNDNKKWNISEYNVTGTGDYTYSYSYPNRKLYVSQVDYDSVKTAKSKIEEILNEK